MRATGHSALVSAALIALPFLPHPARSQAAGTLVGTITSIDRTPLHHAGVRLIGTSLGTETGADGTFRMTDIPAGSYRLELKMLGFAIRLIPVDITAGGVLDLPLMLAAVPVALEVVTVTAPAAGSAHLQGFEQRRARGAGKYFTREDMDRMHVRTVTDVLRRVPGLQFQGVRGIQTDAVSVQTGRNSSLGARSCPMQYYLNGAPFPMPGDMNINNFIDPDAVAAIEVYNGASQIPSQFNSAMYNARCGVVVIWTRVGLVDPRKAR